MSFVLALKKIPKSKKIGKIYVKIGNKTDETYITGEDIYVTGNNLLIFKGNTFPPYTTGKEIFNLIIKKGINEAKKIKGEFFVIFYNNTSKKIYIANDKLGRETLFYYHNKSNFILSNNFWEIVNLIEPKNEDIDVQSIKEFIIFNRPLFFKTIIKNLNFFPPACIGKFSIKKSNFELNNYWDFRYKPDETLELNEAVERLDKLLNGAFKCIKEKHPNAIYGLGLSGGLDSRIIPSYALKHGMKLKSYIIGEKRERRLLLSRSHLSARKIAKTYKLEHSEIEWNCTDFNSKSYYELKYVPMANARFFHTVSKDKLPKFDILLTGMNGGELLGANLPLNIQKLNEEELVDTIISNLSNAYEKSRLAEVLKYLFNIRKRIKDKKRINRLIRREEFIKAKSKIRKFVKAELSKGKSNIDIFQKYLFFLISNNKYNSFSMFWKKINYSVFSDSYLFEETLKWKPDFLLNRRLQRHLYMKKFLYLAKIPSQDYQPAIFYRGKKSYLRKVSSLINYILRGTGLNYRKWSQEKEYINFAKKVLLRKNEFFRRIFNIKEIINDQNPPHENLVKIKQVLDLVQSGEYKKFLE